MDSRLSLRARRSCASCARDINTSLYVTCALAKFAHPCAARGNDKEEKAKSRRTARSSSPVHRLPINQIQPALDHTIRQPNPYDAMNDEADQNEPGEKSDDRPEQHEPKRTYLPTEVRLEKGSAS